MNGVGGVTAAGAEWEDFGDYASVALDNKEIIEGPSKDRNAMVLKISRRTA